MVSIWVYPKRCLRYARDDLGIHYYVNQGQPVHYIAVMVNNNATYEYYPKEEYHEEMTKMSAIGEME